MYLYSLLMCITALCDQVWLCKQRSSITLKVLFHDKCVTRNVTDCKVL